MALDLSGGLKSIDWRAFFLALLFGYSLTCFPLFSIYILGTIEGNSDIWQTVFVRSEPYLIFAIIAFTSVGTLLSNHDSIDAFVSVGCALNVLFGVSMLGIFSYFDSLQIAQATVAENLTQFGVFSWFVSASVFAASHIKTKINREIG